MESSPYASGAHEDRTQGLCQVRPARPGHTGAALCLPPGPGRAPRSARAGTRPGNAPSASAPRAEGVPDSPEVRAGPASHRRGDAAASLPASPRAGRGGLSARSPSERGNGSGGTAGPGAQPAQRHAEPRQRLPSARLQQRRDTNPASGDTAGLAQAVAGLRQ